MAVQIGILWNLIFIWDGCPEIFLIFLYEIKWLILSFRKENNILFNKKIIRKILQIGNPSLI